MGAAPAPFFLSPERPGPVIRGAGISGVALAMRGPWVVHGLVNNTWFFDGNRQDSYNIMTAQPFINDDIRNRQGAFILFLPVVT